MRKMSELLAAALRKDRLGLCVAMPAQVLAYDHTNQRASVQPMLRKIDGESRPIIPNVPVIFPRAGGASLTMPVNVGDAVLLVFLDRSIDDWLARGGEVSLTDVRAHNYNDAVALPGLMPFTGNGPPNNDDVLIEYAGARIIMKANGSVEIIAPTTIQGNVNIQGSLSVSGTINAGGDVVGAGISLSGHVHGGVESGGSTTGGPQ